MYVYNNLLVLRINTKNTTNKYNINKFLIQSFGLRMIVILCLQQINYNTVIYIFHILIS